MNWFCSEEVHDWLETFFVGYGCEIQIYDTGLTETIMDTTRYWIYDASLSGDMAMSAITAMIEELKDECHFTLVMSCEDGKKIEFELEISEKMGVSGFDG